MLPRAGLPGLLLEVDAQAGFAAGLTHLAETGTGMEDLAVRMCAVLVAEACNIGFTPRWASPAPPALTRDRLSRIGQNCVRAGKVTHPGG